MAAEQLEREAFLVKARRRGERAQTLEDPRPCMSTQAPSGVGMSAQYDEQQQPGMGVCPSATTTRPEAKLNFLATILSSDSVCV